MSERSFEGATYKKRTAPGCFPRGPKNRGSRFKKPAPRYDIAKILTAEVDPRTCDFSPGFETEAEIQAETSFRIKSLATWMRASSSGRLLKGRRTADIPVPEVEQLLAKFKSRRVASSFAVPKYMSRFRRGFVGAVLEALDRFPKRNIRLYTVIPRSWRVRGPKLNSVRPKRLLEQFRAQLNRVGISALDGWLIAYLHGEYDFNYDVWQLHLHVLAVGEKAEAIENLRSRALYRPSAHVDRPIFRSPLRHRARQVSYHAAQGYWPSKATVQKSGKSVRTRRRQRIPEPRHAEWLNWFDQQAFTDLVWLHGCKLHDGQIQSEVGNRENGHGEKPHCT